MNNMKKCFVVIFALSLSFAPLAICWYSPSKMAIGPFAIFYYIFHDSPIKEAGRGSNVVSFDSENIMKHEMPLMKIIGFLYAAVLILLFIEFLIQIMKKKNLDKMIKITSIFFLAITVLQFVNAVFYRQTYEIIFDKGDETEWRCMWEINLAELLIAVGLCVNLYKGEKPKIKTSRQILWGHAFYSILLLTAIQGCCFYRARYGIVAECGDYLYDYTMFFGDVLLYQNIQSILRKEGMITLLPILIILTMMIVVMLMKKEIRESVAYVLGIALKIVTILLFCRIIYVCVFLNQRWLIIPDLPIILFLGWGSYRLLCGIKASSGKGVMKET